MERPIYPEDERRDAALQTIASSAQSRASRRDSNRTRDDIMSKPFDLSELTSARDTLCPRCRSIDIDTLAGYNTSGRTIILGKTSSMWPELRIMSSAPQLCHLGGTTHKHKDW